jgi:hypothetical protein
VTSLKAVKYSQSDEQKFDKIALKLGRSKILVLSQMLDYFYRTKKDPIDINDELLKNTIVKGQKDQIGFIRTQEMELLIPIKREVSKNLDLANKIIDALQHQVLQQNVALLNKQQGYERQVLTLNFAMKTLIQKAETKEITKKKMLTIFENYILLRETLGMMSSAKDKESLINQTREQFKLL